MRRSVAAIGLSSWDRFLVLDRYPESGGYATVQHEFEQAGGTTSNTCAALAMLGIDVAFASRVGNDPQADLLIQSLQDAGCKTDFVVRNPDQPTDSSIIMVTETDGLPERTIIWFKGAQPEHRHQLPLDHLLDHRWLLIDVNDDPLREFLLTLPAHLSPRTQLIGAMTYLTDSDPDTALRHFLQHDAMLGNSRELMQITGTSTLEDAITSAQPMLTGNACRVIFLTLGNRGSIAIRATSVTSAPSFEVEVVDTTGAGDAFAAGCIWGLLDGCSDDEILARGNAVGGLCCTAFGARAGLPTRTHVEALRNIGKTIVNDTHA